MDGEITGRQGLHEALYQRLVGAGRDGVPVDPNRDFIAQMLASWLVGRGALPAFMGLDETPFAAMVAALFPDHGPVAPNSDRAPLEDRYDESDDVRALLEAHRAHRAASERWIVEIIAAGCMASDHLWSDLGLFSRPYLTAMMEVNFPELAGRNTQNMKWKKFLYKQLCEGEGLYVCRAPSCQVCADYARCFILPEEEGE